MSVVLTARVGSSPRLVGVSQSDAFWSSLPLGRDVTLLARDRNGLAAFNKPAGVLSHPNRTGEERRSYSICASASCGNTLSMRTRVARAVFKASRPE